MESYGRRRVPADVESIFKKANCKAVPHSLQKTLKPLPTDEMCFGVDEKDNIKDALVWYKRVVLGEIDGDQRGVKRKAERGF